MTVSLGGVMLRILIDTCVWLDIAKDYRHLKTLDVLIDLIRDGEAELIVPQQTLDEFERNKGRIFKETSQGISAVFKRVSDAIRQHGGEEGCDALLRQLADVDYRIGKQGEYANSNIERIERLLTDGAIIQTSDDVKIRAAQRAINKLCPFHKNKNSMADAVLVEIYRDMLAGRGDEEHLAFVTHNKHDFSDMNANERAPHPDVAELFAAEESTYSLALGEVLSAYAPDEMEELKWEFEYEEKPRSLSEILEAEHLLFRQVWYNRHLNLMYRVERGEVEVVDELDKTEKGYYRQDQITRGTLDAALAAGERARKEVGNENLGPWDDFEWGMLNGKLSALRWVTGSEWDFLDT
jgi:PIN domain